MGVHTHMCVYVHSCTLCSAFVCSYVSDFVYMCECVHVLWEFVSVYNYTCAHGIVKVAICSGEVSIQVIRVLIICSAFQEQATVGDW